MYDPEAVYQDADIEMMEAEADANDPDRTDPWKECGWCYPGNQAATATVDIYNGISNKSWPYCPSHRATAYAEKRHVESR